MNQPVAKQRRIIRNSKPRRMPSEKKIRQYWADKNLWRKKDFDSVEEFLEQGICFACGTFWSTKRNKNKGVLERAHILAKMYGGSDECDNLHMLCPQCHKDSEGLQAKEYWGWFFERTRLDMTISRCSKYGVNIWSAIISGDENTQLSKLE